MLWNIIRKISSVLTIVIACIFISHGVDRLVLMTADQKDEFSIFKYMHAIETAIIGLFFLVAEFKSPLFKKNINIAYRPTPKSVLILIFSIFLYTSTEDHLDFYLVLGMAASTLLLSFYTKKPKNHDSEVNI